MILVSACLLGHKTKYNGGSNPQALLLRYQEQGKFLPVCPECMGQLPIPHPPAEIQGGSGAAVWQGRACVLDKDGRDVTKNFRVGAEKIAQLAQEKQIQYAILKERSPSCGVTQIYDGSFSGTTILGQGVCTAYLRKLGVRIFSEEELTEALLQQILSED